MNWKVIGTTIQSDKGLVANTFGGEMHSHCTTYTHEEAIKNAQLMACWPSQILALCAASRDAE